MDDEIKFINDIIIKSINYGSIHGGNYELNKEKLFLSIQNWLEFKGLTDSHTVKVSGSKDENGIWNVYQQIKEKEIKDDLYGK